jgi:uncharacterized protein YggE
MRFLILAACASLAACTERAPDPRGVERDEILVRTTGTARAEARPDEARFSAGVSSIAASGPEASTANARKMNGVVAALKALGINENDIQTRNLSVGRVEYGPNRGRFEANNTVVVRVRQIDRAGALIGAATGAGANILSGPELRVADPEAATRKAYADAYRAARARADAYADAAGVKVARVLAIRDASTRPNERDGVLMEQTMSAPVPVAAPPVLAGTSESQVAVTVDFALGPK